MFFITDLSFLILLYHENTHKAMTANLYFGEKGNQKLTSHPFRAIIFTVKVFHLGGIYG